MVSPVSSLPACVSIDENRFFSYTYSDKHEASLKEVYSRLGQGIGRAFAVFQTLSPHWRQPPAAGKRTGTAEKILKELCYSAAFPVGGGIVGAIGGALILGRLATPCIAAGSFLASALYTGYLDAYCSGQYDAEGALFYGLINSAVNFIPASGVLGTLLLHHITAAGLATGAALLFRRDPLMRDELTLSFASNLLIGFAMATVMSKPIQAAVFSLWRAPLDELRYAAQVVPHDFSRARFASQRGAVTLDARQTASVLREIRNRVESLGPLHALPGLIEDLRTLIPTWVRDPAANSRLLRGMTGIDDALSLRLQRQPTLELEPLAAVRSLRHDCATLHVMHELREPFQMRCEDGLYRPASIEDFNVNGVHLLVTDEYGNRVRLFLSSREMVFFDGLEPAVQRHFAGLFPLPVTNRTAVLAAKGDRVIEISLGTEKERPGELLFIHPRQAALLEYGISPDHPILYDYPTVEAANRQPFPLRFESVFQFGDTSICRQSQILGVETIPASQLSIPMGTSLWWHDRFLHGTVRLFVTKEIMLAVTKGQRFWATVFEHPAVQARRNTALRKLLLRKRDQLNEHFEDRTTEVVDAFREWSPDYGRLFTALIRLGRTDGDVMLRDMSETLRLGIDNGRQRASLEDELRRGLIPDYRGWRGIDETRYRAIIDASIEQAGLQGEINARQRNGIYHSVEQALRGGI